MQMISIIDLILEEKKEQKFPYGCVMLYFDFPEMNKVQKAIDSADLYKPEEDDGRSYGFEDEPHVTLLYGLHDTVTLEEVKGVLDHTLFSELKLYNVSKFDNPKYDVLKFDAKGKSLYEANEALKKFPFTSDYPDYHPHNTIGYLKKGSADKYIQELKGKEYEITPTHAVYSVPDGTQHQIKINLAKS